MELEVHIYTATELDAQRTPMNNKLTICDVQQMVTFRAWKLSRC